MQTKKEMVDIYESGDGIILVVDGDPTQAYYVEPDSHGQDVWVNRYLLDCKHLLDGHGAEWNPGADPKHYADVDCVSRIARCYDDMDLEIEVDVDSLGQFSAEYLGQE